MDNKLDKQYIELLKDILENGVEKDTRNGKTLSVFGRQIRYKFKDGEFPLLTTKKMAFKTMVTELLWFLKGSTNIKYLVDNNSHIWDGDAYKSYHNMASSKQEPDYEIHVDNPNENQIRVMTQKEFIERIKNDNEFAKKYGELGPIYGSQWRNWGGELPFGEAISSLDKGIDQIQELINNIKNNPDSRRLVVSAWNPSVLKKSVLPPCHHSFQVYTRELSHQERNLIYVERFGKITEKSLSQLNELHIPKRAISLMFNMRSSDVPLGLPFNIASYGLLLEIIGKMVNMVPEELVGNMGDCHIYKNQIDGVKEQLSREGYSLPKIEHMKTDDFYKTLSGDMSLISHLDSSDFVLTNYKSHPSIKMPLSN